MHFLLFLDTIQSFLVLDDLFYWFVYHFNDYSSFDHFNYALIDGPFLDSIIMFTVQIVYCWRLCQLGGWRVIPAVTAFASILQHWSQKVMLICSCVQLVFVSCSSGMFIGIYVNLSSF